jgi:hypothetical protein
VLRNSKKKAAIANWVIASNCFMLNYKRLGTWPLADPCRSGPEPKPVENLKIKNKSCFINRPVQKLLKKYQRLLGN